MRQLAIQMNLSALFVVFCSFRELHFIPLSAITNPFEIVSQSKSVYASVKRTVLFHSTITNERFLSNLCRFKQRRSGLANGHYGQFYMVGLACFFIPVRFLTSFKFG